MAPPGETHSFSTKTVVEIFSTWFLQYRMFWTLCLGNPTKPSPCVLDPLSTDRPPTSYESLDEYLRNLPEFYRRFMYHYKQTASKTVVWRAFRSRRRLEIITDTEAWLPRLVPLDGVSLVPPPILCFKARAQWTVPTI